jgi:hypothetical protein
VLPDIAIDPALRLGRRCATHQLVPVLRENAKEHVEGLYLPYQEDGMYATTEIQ